MPGSVFPLAGHSVSVLGDGDVSALQQLHERCADYVALVTGEPPGPTEAEELLCSLPPGKQAADKFVLGIWRGDDLVAALDLIRDIPTPGAWWVGNLMLDPAQRGHGLGERIYRGCEEWMRSQGAQRVGLCVQEQNPGALRFWSRMGFEEVERVPHRLKSLDSVVAVMRRTLSPA